MSASEPRSPESTRSLVAAGILFVDEADRVMLVRPTYKPYWDIPGGYVEPGETPKQACVREVAEELGLTTPIGELLSVDWAPHPDEGDKILFIFDGGRLTADVLAAIEFRDDELSEHAFVAVDDLDRFTVPRLVRRLSASLAARRAGRPTYLEHGMTPAA